MEQFLWCIFLAVPILVVWVFGLPLIAFIVLVRHRHNLEDWSVKKYYLLLYQGLKPNRFYWEFVNTIRKFIILISNVFLVSYTPYCRLFVTLSKSISII